MAQRAPERYLTRTRRWMGTALLVALSIGFALCLAEGAFNAILAFPRTLRMLPPNAVAHLRTYYMRFDRVLLQAIPECAQYDPGLFYTLRPGSCRFRAREFDVRIEANSQGLRDDEESLLAPDVVVLGDSYAMGWGVEQGKTFPDRLEALSGLKVLNAGLPSYGTAREMRIMSRLDIRRMRVLVIQYADNDVIENLAFRDHHDALDIGSRSRYERDLQRVAGRHRYFFGKTTYRIVEGILRPRERQQPRLPPAKEARLFLRVLARSLDVEPAGLQIIVVELSPIERMNGAFAAALAAECLDPSLPEVLRQMKVLDLRLRLGAKDYFDLDDHLRASGHAVVAQALHEAIAGQHLANP